MDNKYFTEGYNLMFDYMKKQRILTKERNFRRRLDNFYNNHKDEDWLSEKDEFEYLELERYFYTNILPPSNNEEKALSNMLDIFLKSKRE